MSTGDPLPSEAGSAHPGRRGWTIVLVIALCAAVAQAFGRFSYGLVLPAVRDDLGISNAMAGALGGANVGAYLLGTVGVAWATSRFRLLTVLRLGVALAATGLLLASLAASPLVLAAALFVAGVGGACVWIPAPMVAADAVPARRRALAVGLTGSGIGVGVVSASLLAAYLRADLGDNAWALVYRIEGAVGVLALLAVLWLVRHAQAVPSGGGGLGGFGALRRMPGWRPLLVAYSTFGFMYLLVLGFLTTRLEDDSAWTGPEAAFAFTLVGAAMVFGAAARDGRPAHRRARYRHGRLRRSGPCSWASCSPAHPCPRCSHAWVWDCCSAASPCS
ncbi:MAG: MFS transporter [Gammaproteobacteria bacterium]|nr:MFS transporter [Gammaproteobacteria bacterium]